MGFRVRIAPGIRVGVSSRGIRTSVGPRIARVHVGGGRTGFSTGVGPISYYKSVGGSSSRSSSSGSSSSYSGASFRTQDSKAQARHDIEAILNKWTKAHEKNFAAAARKLAKLDPTTPLEELFEEEKAKALAGIGFFKFKERKEAKALATRIAGERKVALEQAALAKQAEEQAEFDLVWKNLSDGDPSEVYTAITDAFDDNASKSAVIDIDGEHVTLMVLVPGVGALPDYDWTYTAAGNLSVRKMTVGSRNNYYYDLIGSQVLATLKEAFAVAPSVKEATVVVIRSRDDQHPELGADCISCVTVSRTRMNQELGKNQTGPTAVLHAASKNGWSLNMNSKMVISPINLKTEPDIKKLLDALEFGELEHAQETQSHIGVKVATAKSTSTKKAVPKKSPPSYDYDEVYESKTSAADIDLEVRAMDLALRNKFLTETSLQSELSLSEKEAKQMLDFLEMAQVLGKPKSDGKYACVISSDQRPNYLEDIHGSISFRSF